jgi:hypothetical protein
LSRLDRPELRARVVNGAGVAQYSARGTTCICTLAIASTTKALLIG